MSKEKLSRRKILSSVAVAGGGGILVGTGTGALFTDQESFTNNSIAASKSVAGHVDLDVTVEELGDTGVEYAVTLPTSGRNNPALIWVRTSECPVFSSFADALRVRLKVECPDGETRTLLTGSLREILDSLRDGYQLSCDSSDGCLQPGDSVRVILDIVGVPHVYDGDESELSFELEFFGKQCRYNEEVESPFEPIEPCEPTGGKAISFIAFCTEQTGSTLEPVVVETLTTDDDGPTSIEWQTNIDVDYVVVKGGQYFTIYDYRGLDVTSGIATTGGDSDYDFYDTLSDDSTGGGGGGGKGKGKGKGNDGVSGSANSRSSEPCELAADKVGNGSFSGQSVKLEYENGTFTEES